MTNVFNLLTQEELHYDLPPDEAVKAAYLQSIRRSNTWDYPSIRVHIERGNHSVACGDFAALLAPNKRTGVKNRRPDVSLPLEMNGVVAG